MLRSVQEKRRTGCDVGNAKFGKGLVTLGIEHIKYVSYTTIHHSDLTVSPQYDVPGVRSKHLDDHSQHAENKTGHMENRCLAATPHPLLMNVNSNSSQLLHRGPSRSGPWSTHPSGLHPPNLTSPVRPSTDRIWQSIILLAQCRVITPKEFHASAATSLIKSATT